MAGKGASRDSTPVILTTGEDRVLLTGAQGTPTQLPTEDLINRLRVPVEITELHFDLTETGDPDLAQKQRGMVIGSVEIDLSVGRRVITRGFCSVLGITITRDAFVTSTNPEDDPIFYRQVRWILPRPLLLAPNEGFEGSARVNPRIARPVFGGTAGLAMTARGRRLSPGYRVPSVRAIPYATGWIFTTPNEYAPDQTFQNVFNAPLNVASLNGVPCNASAPLQGIVPTGTVTTAGPGGLMGEPTRSLATALRGGLLFSQRQAIEEPHVLDPREAYTVQMAEPRGPLAGGTRPYNGSAIVLTGWREE